MRTTGFLSGLLLTSAVFAAPLPRPQDDQNIDDSNPFNTVDRRAGVDLPVEVPSTNLAKVELNAVVDKLPVGVSTRALGLPTDGVTKSLPLTEVTGELKGVSGGLPVKLPTRSFGFPTGDMPAGGFPTDGFPSGGFPTDGFPSGGLPTGGFAPGQEGGEYEGATGGLPFKFPTRSLGLPTDSLTNALPVDKVTGEVHGVTGALPVKLPARALDLPTDTLTNSLPVDKVTGEVHSVTGTLPVKLPVPVRRQLEDLSGTVTSLADSLTSALNRLSATLSTADIKVNGLTNNADANTSGMIQTLEADLGSALETMQTTSKSLAGESHASTLEVQTAVTKVQGMALQLVQDAQKVAVVVPGMTTVVAKAQSLLKTAEDLGL